MYLDNHSLFVNVFADVFGMRETQNIQQVWPTADSSGYALSAVVFVAFCC